MNMDMRRYRCEVETDGDADPLQCWTTSSELGVLFQRHPYTPAAAVPCERVFLYPLSTKKAVGTGALRKI